MFTRVDLKKNDCLNVVGILAKSKECVKYCESHAFSTKLSKNDEIIEGSWVPLGFGGIVNHASNPSHQNVEMDFVDGMPAFRFLRNIEKGEEILGNYGQSFTNILATFLTLQETGDLVHWQRDCEKIADSKEGIKLYEKIFASVFETP